MENHYDLYKNRQTKTLRQTQRREALLEEQKHARYQIADEHRNGYISEIRKSSHTNKKVNPNFKDKLQLSDWLIEKPVDLENWYLVPCPKGMRCLITSSNGHTVMYNKYGESVKKFSSNLPGNSLQQLGITVLDGIYVSQTNTIYILDLLTYGHQDMLNCETSFRFFWIKSKIDELELMERSETNQIAMCRIPYYDFANENDILDCLTKYPQFENNRPELDGFLFYHKEASYTHGVTPLVGWLFPFMMQDVFQYPFIHQEYNKHPKDYTNFMEYIIEFNRKYLAKSRRRNNKRNKITEIEVEHESMDYIEVYPHDGNLDDSQDTVEEFQDD